VAVLQVTIMVEDSAPKGAQHFNDSFANDETVANYADRVARFVPGYHALHTMTGVLLAEATPADAKVLVVGAGGGLELLALAEMHAGWSFVGVDPSRKMLGQARQTLGSHASRVELVEGVVDAAPAGPFDAAACLLTLHFLDADERRRTLEAVRSRLKPNAPLVVAHASFPQAYPERSIWLDRYEAYAVASGGDREQARTARKAIDEASGKTMLDPAHDEEILAAAGFSDVRLFYQAFTWRGWVALA